MTTLQSRLARGVLVALVAIFVMSASTAWRVGKAARRNTKTKSPTGLLKSSEVVQNAGSISFKNVSIEPAAKGRSRNSPETKP